MQALSKECKIPIYRSACPSPTIINHIGASRPVQVAAAKVPPSTPRSLCSQHSLPSDRPVAGSGECAGDPLRVRGVPPSLHPGHRCRDGHSAAAPDTSAPPGSGAGTTSHQVISHCTGTRRAESDRVRSGRDRSGRAESGRTVKGRKGSSRIGSSRVGSGRVGSGVAGSGRVGSG